MASAPQKIRIGRDAACDFVLSDKSVSRRHADLFVDSSGSMEILDLESSSGTYIVRDGKEESVTRAKLKPSDLIRFGEVELTYKDLQDRAQKSSRPKDASVRHVTPPTLPIPDAAAKRASPPPLPKAGTKPGGRMMRCECGTIKKKGSTCPACGSS